MNQLLGDKNFITTSWAGGKTTELFIFPRSTSFKDGNFSFRLSTASVEIEESVFSALPEVTRSLMVLEGEMELTHLHQHKKMLRKFNVDYFNGGWQTHSKGKCMDFNLMTKGKTEGILNAFTLKKNDRIEYDFTAKNKMHFVYLIKGELKVMSKSEDYHLIKGNLLVIDSPAIYSFSASQFSEYIIIKVS
jgi:environmental stress-induced protein Ves